MIEKMHKYTFLVFHKQYNDFLYKLQEVGVLHVKEKPEGNTENDALRDKLQLAAQVDKTIGEAFALLTPDMQPLPQEEQFDGAQLVNEFVEMKEEALRIETALDRTQKEADRMAVWGNYSTDLLHRLADEGFVLQFFSIGKARFNQEWETEKNAFVVADNGSTLYFVTVNRQPVELDADVVTLNEHNQMQLEQDMQNLKGLLVAQQGKMQAWTVANLNNLKKFLADIRNGIVFDKVLLNTTAEADNKVMLLEGYCPVDTEKDLIALLEAEHIYFQKENPDITDADIPVKLKNNWFARLFEPITKLYALPKYDELDPTAFFAPFFMLFFGLCMGDGGYGLLILVAATIAKYKMPKFKSVATLCQFLGLATLVVGILTGMVFGIKLDEAPWPWLANVKHLFVTSTNYADKLGGYDPLMVFAIAIGVFQILFAMGFNVVKITILHGFKYAVSTLAWLVGLVCLILMFLLPVAGVELSKTALNVLYVLAGICGVFILFYNSPGKNIFVNFGSGLWGTYGMVSGLLGDVLSYIRLFALGLAGGILGNVFNQLALNLSSGMPAYIGWLPMLLILLIGHGLNFMLCIISSVVHPLRLTFVEFYKNAGFEGGGKAYHPFSKQTTEQE